MYASASHSISTSHKPRQDKDTARDRWRVIGLEQGRSAVGCIRWIDDAPAVGVEDWFRDVGALDELALHHAAVILSLLSYLQRGWGWHTRASNG